MLWKYLIRHNNSNKKYLIEIFIYMYYKYYIKFNLFFNNSLNKSFI